MTCSCSSTSHGSSLPGYQFLTPGLDSSSSRQQARHPQGSALIPLYLNRTLLHKGLNLSLLFPKPHLDTDPHQKVLPTCALPSPPLCLGSFSSSHDPTSASSCCLAKPSPPERVRLVQAMWLVVELCWLTFVPFVIIKQCHQAWPQHTLCAL